MLTMLAMPTPRRVPISRQRLDRDLVAVVGELGDERADDLAAVRERAAEPRAGVLTGEPRSPRATSAVPEASASRQPRLGQLPWQGGPVHVDDHVAEFGTGARSHRGRGGRRGSGRRRSRSRSSAGRRRRSPWAAPAACSARIARLPSLSTNTGSPSRSAMTSANRTPASCKVGREDGRPRPVVDQAGDPEADGRDLDRRCARRPTGRHRRTVLISSDWSRPTTVRCTRWCTPSPESSAPASSFVPPMSTPITCRVGMSSLYGVHPWRRHPDDPRRSEPPEYRVYRSGSGEPARRRRRPAATCRFGPQGAAVAKAPEPEAGRRRGRLDERLAEGVWRGAEWRRSKPAPRQSDSGERERPYRTYRSAPRGLLARLRGESDPDLELSGPPRSASRERRPERVVVAAPGHGGGRSSTSSSPSSAGSPCRSSCS